MTISLPRCDEGRGGDAHGVADSIAMSAEPRFLYVPGTFCLTLIVVGVSLFVGAILRTSNILAFLLFGQRISVSK